MNCNNRISASALLAAASLAFSPAAWSLGLGDATVESFLNQPLKARIDLISQASDDLASVTARLASADDYALIGASRESVSVPVRFSVEDIEGDAYILATSDLPVGDPVLRLIVEVNWSSGRMLREYTLFLDPPAVPAAAPAPRIDQRARPAPPPATAPQPDGEAEPAAPARPATPTTTTAAKTGEYGPVRSGDTLWSIASNWARGSDLNINQVMIAIQRENPDAFLNNNINLLKRGAILRMPLPAEVETISTSAANRQVAEQEAEFVSARAAESVVSPATPLLADEGVASVPIDQPAAAVEAPAEPAASDAAAESAQIEAVAEEAALDETAVEDAAVAEDAPADEQAAAVEQPQDVLELVPPSSDSDLESAVGFEETEEIAEAGIEVSALRENLARTEEELINQQQQNAYLEERIRELETQLADAGEGRVDDAELASMEERLREQRESAAAQPEREAPWYNRLSFWLIGLLVLVVAFVGWLISRRGRTDAAEVAVEESLRDIQSEAEDVLRVLAEDTTASAATQEVAERAVEDEVAAAEEEESTRAGVDEGDAELLDEESSDPEIQLDLARAYISMGDKEAARVILDEVINNGTEEQKSEAQKMLDLLA